jgi:hypothetical protein
LSEVWLLNFLRTYFNMEYYKYSWFMVIGFQWNSYGIDVFFVVIWWCVHTWRFANLTIMETWMMIYDRYMCIIANCGSLKKTSPSPRFISNSPQNSWCKDL